MGFTFRSSFLAWWVFEGDFRFLGNPFSSFWALGNGNLEEEIVRVIVTQLALSTEDRYQWGRRERVEIFSWHSLEDAPSGGRSWGPLMIRWSMIMGPASFCASASGRRTQHPISQDSDCSTHAVWHACAPLACPSTEGDEIASFGRK